MSNVPGVGVTSHRLSRFTATAPATRSCPASGDWIEPIPPRSESNRSLNGGLSSSDPLRIPIPLRDDQRRPELARKLRDNAVRSLPAERAARTLAFPDAQSVEDLTALLTSAGGR